MDWYYLSDKHERIAVSEAQLVPLALRGVLRPATPVWRKGMAGWASCGEVKPELFTGAVSGTNDQPHSGALTAVIDGTVIELARTLASYRVWLRIFGIVLLIVCAGLCISTAVTIWYWALPGEEQWRVIQSSLGVSNLPQAAVWAMVAFNVLNIFLTAWGGFVLLCAASRSANAAKSGSMPLLTAAIRDTGRYFITVVVSLLLTLVFWAAMLVWLGRQVTFPDKGVPPDKAVSV